MGKKRKLKSKFEQYTANRVNRLIGKWMILLGLKNYWCVNVKFYDYIEYSSNNKERELVFTCNVQSEYRQATIKSYLPTIAKLSNRELEESVVHEFMHIVLRGVGGKAIERWHEERICTELANAIYRLPIGKKRVKRLKKFYKKKGES